MPITTSDGYLASAKQSIMYTKTAGATVAASLRYTVQNTAGNPTTLAIPATASPGALFTAGTTGFPTINNMSGSLYLSRVQFTSSVTGHYEIWDKIWGMVGPVLTTLATTPVTSPPSISGRVPGGTDYSGVRAFLEISTAFTGATATTFQITYTNQAGVAAKSSPVITLGNYAILRWIDIPLAAGDTGIQKVESVIIGGTVATAGAYNIILCRLLWRGRINSVYGADTVGIDKTGLTQLFPTSALVCTTISDGATSGIIDMNMEISAA